jgi:hypothetical protein
MQKGNPTRFNAEQHRQYCLLHAHLNDTGFEKAFSLQAITAFGTSSIKHFKTLYASHYPTTLPEPWNQGP